MRTARLEALQLEERGFISGRQKTIKAINEREEAPTHAMLRAEGTQAKPRSVCAICHSPHQCTSCYVASHILHVHRVWSDVCLPNDMLHRRMSHCSTGEVEQQAISAHKKLKRKNKKLAKSAEKTGTGPKEPQPKGSKRKSSPHLEKGSLSDNSVKRSVKKGKKKGSSE